MYKKPETGISSNVKWKMNVSGYCKLVFNIKMTEGLNKALRKTQCAKKHVESVLN